MKINDVLFEFAPAGGGGSGNYFQELASAWYNGTFDTGSLQKGIKSQEDVERLLNRGIVCPDGKTRKLHIDYNSDFDGVEIYSDDYYEYGDHDDTIDSRTGQKWGPYDFMAFSDEDLSEGLTEVDRRGFLKGVGAAAVAGAAGYKMGQDGASNNGNPYTVDKLSSEDLKAIDSNLTWYAIVRRYGKPRINGPRDYDNEMEAGTVKDLMKVYGKDFIFSRLKKIQDKVFAMSDQELEREFNRFWTGPADTSKSAYIYNKLLPDYKLNKESVEQGVAEGLNEFAADDGDGGGEDDALRNYAKMWWAGDEATQMQIEKVLARMGWEIGEDEGGYDNGGVFVVRAGDENGNSYQSWAAEDLTEDGALDNYRSRIGTQGNIQRQNQRQQDWLDAHHQSSLDRMTNHRDAMNRLSNAGVDDTIARQEIRRERMRKDDDDWDKTFDVMRDRLNRYQWSSQKDNAEQGVAEGKPREKEADYGADYQDMVSRVKKLAGLGPLKTVYDPQKRVYKNVPTAVQPKKEQR